MIDYYLQIKKQKHYVCMSLSFIDVIRNNNNYLNNKIYCVVVLT